MKITRMIDGVAREFELTDDELADAHRAYHVAWFQGRLREMGIDAPGVAEEAFDIYCHDWETTEAEALDIAVERFIDPLS